MNMFGQVSLGTILLLMIYGAGAATALIACLYLLLRRGNAFAPSVVPPRRLRLWTAVFFAIMAMGHFWYLPAAVLTTEENIRKSMFIGGLLDCLTVLPLAIIIMLCMLQDRRRPLWPVVGIMVPPIAILALSIINSNDDLLPIFYAYFVLLGIGLTVYMVHAVRQYGRWLHDNYADLEHKEVWQSFVVIATIMLMFVIYIGGYGGKAYEFIIQTCGITLICYLLWRVETLSDLSIQHLPSEDKPAAIQEESEEDSSSEDAAPHLAEALSNINYDNISSLLQEHCIGRQLYLQHDLTAAQLARVLGTNRSYLSLYFSRLGTTYNTYINDLRIKHFVALYRDTVKSGRPFTAQQLSYQSGYRSYSTFSIAFKQRMGQSVKTWMGETDGQPDWQD